MVFPFTFSFTVPGLVNPFSFLSSPIPRPLAEEPVRFQKSPTSQRTSTAQPNPMPSNATPAPPYHPPRPTRAQLPKINRPRPNLSPSPSPSPAPPVSRKRGWEPDPSPSWSTTSLTLASTSGYIDTPSKYLQMAHQAQEQDGYAGLPIDDDDMPPLKKRRGLAGSIVNTAVSAALIGTAVGLTVYRLWRDRGKEGQQQHMIEGPTTIAASSSDDSITDPASQPPPPPYQERNEWQAVSLSQPPAVRVEHATPGKGKGRLAYANANTNTSYNTYTNTESQPVGLAPPTTTPRTVPTTPRSAAAAKRRREIQAAKRPVALVPRHRRQKSNVSSSGMGSQPGTSTKAEFDFGYATEQQQQQQAGEEEEEDQMDWIGGKLAELIEQGRRALNTEVVVMSEAPQDEVDDGTGAWDSDDDNNDTNARSSRPVSRAGSIRSVKRGGKPKPIPIGVPSYHTQQGVGLGIGMGMSSGTPPSTAVSYASASAGFVPSSSASSAYSFSVASSGPVRGMAFDVATPPSSSAQYQQQEQHEWESPLVRESMERARARLMARRAGGAGV